MAKYDYGDIAEKLKVVSIFSEFSNTEIAKLAEGGTILFFKKDTTICVEGESSRGLYIVISGAASIFKNSKKTEHLSRIAHLDVGHSFGEISLIDNAPRSATVVADSDLELFEIKSSFFDSFLKEGGTSLELKFYRRTTVYLAEIFRTINEDYISTQSLLWKYALSKDKK
jgi:CRP-like cAMP-binding protein